MYPNQDIEQIEKYLTNQLSESEKIAFEGRLEKDEVLRATYSKHELAHKALDYLITKNLKQQLMELEAADEEQVEEADQDNIISINRKKNKTRRLRWIGLAATFALLVSFVFLNYFNQSSLTGPALANSLYQLPEASIRAADGNPIYPEVLLEEGIQALNNRDYAKAIDQLTQIPEDGAYFYEAQYFLGHAYYNSDQFADALKAFDIMISSDDFRFLPDANWFALLSCVALENDCQNRLNTILNNPKHKYYNAALKLKRQL